MTFIKRFLYLSFGMIVLSFWFVHWDISNIFEINPSITTWKYYCDTVLTTDIDYVSDEYAWFEFNLNFDTWALTLVHDSINWDFVNDTSSS